MTMQYIEYVKLCYMADNIIDIDDGSCNVIQINSYEKEHILELYEKQKTTINGRAWYKIKRQKNNKNGPMSLWYSLENKGRKPLWKVKYLRVFLVYYHNGKLKITVVNI